VTSYNSNQNVIAATVSILHFHADLVIIMWSSLGGRIKCCTPSIRLSFPCLQFTWKGKTGDTSNSVET